ncbi:MAG: hypothetical protein VKN60_02995 [Cyanobacteriota bacterium]|nr:hypothetical protein [Cyanobacteriota bacterium]
MTPALDRALETQTVYYPRLPLAVYRELAAHLSQISGVETEILPQTAPVFDYDLSQAEGLKVSYPGDLDAQEKAWLEQILAYYQTRYGA